MKRIGILLLVLCSCSPETEERSLAPEDFEQKIKTTSDAVVLDVRTEEEVSQGHIAGAVHYDYQQDDFEEKIAGLDKSKTYFVYCGSGVRSSKAMAIMKTAGFEKCYGLEGGIKAWKEKGLALKQ
jgi:rhodanese-related sulfurtransferase